MKPPSNQSLAIAIIVLLVVLILINFDSIASRKNVSSIAADKITVMMRHSKDNSTSTYTQTLSPDIEPIPSTRTQATPVTQTYNNDELGFSIALPAGYSVVQNNLTVTISTAGTPSQPFMEIQALPAPFDPSKDSYSNLKSYTDTTLPNMVSSQTTLSGVPAMQVDDMRVFSMPNLDATIDTHSVQSSNIVGYKKFKDFFIWGHGSLFKISYFDGDSSIFDPIVQTFILKDTPNGKDETQQ